MKNKIILVIIILLVLCTSFIFYSKFFQGKQYLKTIENSQYMNFENKGAGFKIDYPSILKFRTDEKNLTTFYKPNEKMVEDGGPAVFDFYIGIFSREKGLTEATRDVEDLKKMAEINGNRLLDLKREDIKIDNLPARKYIFNAYTDDTFKFPIKVMKIFIVRDDVIYGIDHSNNLENFDKDLPMVMKMIESFKAI